MTFGTLTWVWSVVVDDALYVRAYHGQRSRWFQAAMRERAGQITAAGMTQRVSFELAPAEVHDRVDAAYREKYGDSDYLAPMISAPVRATTVKISPCAEATLDGVRLAEQVSPALVAGTRSRLETELRSRPGLAPRDRSLVTLAALISRGQVGSLAPELDRALDRGVTPAEVSETILHLAYYAGPGEAMAATGPAAAVFSRRGVSTAQLPPAQERLLPIDEAAEQQRATSVEAAFGMVAPGLLHYTTEALFLELWRRPGLAPRDRSLVTLSALIATGQPAQVTYHLGRAMDQGLTQEEASEALTQLAFYAGWPRVFSALPVVKEVFASRGP